MRTIVLIIATVIYGITVSAQSFTQFDEGEKSYGKIFIAPKGKKEVVITGGYGGWIIDHQGFYKKMYSDLVKVFKNLSPEEQEILQRMSVYLCMSKHFKGDYVEFVFDKEDRAYVLQNEELFYKWAKSFENMNEYKPFLEREGVNPGMHVSILVKYLFKEKYK